jgi:hypothetical protein
MNAISFALEPRDMIVRGGSPIYSDRIGTKSSCLRYHQQRANRIPRQFQQQLSGSGVNVRGNKSFATLESCSFRRDRVGNLASSRTGDE